MIAFMDLNEQADKDFDRARRRAFMRWLTARFRHDPLPIFEDARSPLCAYNRVRLGTREVEVGRIVGSVGRRMDFDRSFMPLRADVGERWKRMDLAYHRAEDLPPVELYKLGDAYFVLDGNHRVSVARYHGTPTLEAVVTEFRPSRAGDFRSQVTRSLDRRIPQSANAA